MKESKQISLGSSDSTTTAADFKYSMSGKVISITYSGPGSVDQDIGRIMRRIEHWHQGSVKSYRILYQNADGLGGEVNWDGENAESSGCGDWVGGFVDRRECCVLTLSSLIYSQSVTVVSTEAFDGGWRASAVP